MTLPITLLTRKSVMSTVLKSALILICSQLLAQEAWIAPESANQMTNPVAKDATSIKSGSKIFQSMCWTCHGNGGKGDGPASAGLVPKPGNLTSEQVQAQTDGALFWKISEGRGPMSSYKTTLSTTQRWQLINYLRTLRQ